MDSTRWAKLRRQRRRLYTLVTACLHGARAGKGSIIMPGAVISREHGGDIILGPKTVIHRGAMLLSYGGRIRLGARCSVNPYSVLYGHGGLDIGDHVRIAAHCVLVPANHGFARDSGLIMEQPLSRRGIRIGNDVWLGAGVRVLDGAAIGDGCVVAAGAVVRGELEPYGIYGGVPARRLGWRKAKTVNLREAQHGATGAHNPEAVAAP